ncbi:hypothetical protein DNTS_028956 [Danionella cerebrum]|uniref:WH2 domain-containing protein n=1 Tax=Danionella cerebrum TaxID=2873325 RepID=A0A553RAK4_9TELE|nr:hypothetical protein DNTS_028956 [Danionella translucida]
MAAVGNPASAPLYSTIEQTISKPKQELDSFEFDRFSQAEEGKEGRSPAQRRMKARAPPPPRPPQPAPRRIFRNAAPDGGGSLEGDSKENMLRSSVDLHISLPSGYQTTISVDGRKALMDLLVDLCSQYHLNPAYHTLELLSPDAQPIGFKPNALLGALDVSCALIKERVLEDKVIRKPPPKVPEKTVRLVVNYHRSQKAVVRVNPLVPLRTLVPVICQKCEFEPANVLLFKDNVSRQQLDLDRSLGELGIRDLYVLDQTLAESLHSSSLTGSEKKGLLGFLKFNRRKTKPEDQSSEGMESVDAMVVENADLNGMSVSASGTCIEARPSTLGQSQSLMNISKMSPKVELKKRRAPPPPRAPTQTLSLTSQMNLGSLSSQNQLKKRKAPAPPPQPVISTPGEDCKVSSVPVSVEKSMLPILRAPTPADDSDLSHSIEDSEPARSICSSSSGDDAAAGSSSSSVVEEPVSHQVHVMASFVAATPESEPKYKEEAAHSSVLEHEPSLLLEDTTENLETEMELTMDEMENNRHSGIGGFTLKSMISIAVHLFPCVLDAGVAVNEKWLLGWTNSSHKPVTEGIMQQEMETMSLASSESFADQGYAASEGMTEESGPVSPSERMQSVSPVDILTLNGSSALSVKQDKYSSSDSDEGCPTWGSRQSSGNIHSGLDPIKIQNGFEVDPEITAEIHLTLANLDANLADISHIDGAADFIDDIIPVSIVDVDIPVTSIDEVLDDDDDDDEDDQCCTAKYASTLPSSTPNITCPPFAQSEAIQNKNNNARLKEETYRIRLQEVQDATPAPQESTSPQINIRQPIPSQLLDKMDQNVVLNSETQAHFIEITDERDVASRKFQGIPRSAVQNIQKVNPSISRVPPSQGKITQSSVSRFGMKTFTVIPPKPAMSQTKPSGSLVIGAIKIDEQGNMVSQRRPSSGAEKIASPNGDVSSADKSHLDKAKAFWNTTERQEQAAMVNQAPVINNGDSDGLKPSASNRSPQLSVKTPPEETLKVAIILERKPISVVTNHPKPNVPYSKVASISNTPKTSASMQSTETTHLLQETDKSENASEANQGNLFGPVQKFKPVQFKPLQKETSIHSSLMEAIQSGEGIQRLRKVSELSASFKERKPSFNDPENDRSALLSAIRASGSSSRLKKTKSVASKELEQLRKVDEDRNAQLEVTRTSPPGNCSVFVPPLPPALNPPPPPPPPSAPTKPPLVLPAGGNPEAAREALLEAIRSGSGAQRLRKVPASNTRRQVNGRLGTIQAASPLSYVQ